MIADNYDSVYVGLLLEILMVFQVVFDAGHAKPV
jgi:hypothetical protein